METNFLESLYWDNKYTDSENASGSLVKCTRRKGSESWRQEAWTTSRRASERRRRCLKTSAVSRYSPFRRLKAAINRLWSQLDILHFFHNYSTVQVIEAYSISSIFHHCTSYRSIFHLFHNSPLAHRARSPASLWTGLIVTVTAVIQTSAIYACTTHRIPSRDICKFQKWGNVFSEE